MFGTAPLHLIPTSRLRLTLEVVQSMGAGHLTPHGFDMGNTGQYECVKEEYHEAEKYVSRLTGFFHG